MEKIKKFRKIPELISAYHFSYFFNDFSPSRWKCRGKGADAVIDRLRFHLADCAAMRKSESLRRMAQACRRYAERCAPKPRLLPLLS